MGGKSSFPWDKNTGNRTMSKEMEFRNEVEKKERRIRNNLRKGQSLSIPSNWAMHIFEGYREKEENEYKCPPRGPSSHFPSFSSRFFSLSLSASIALLTSVHVSEGKSPLENPRLDAGPTLPLPYPFSAKKGPLLSLLPPPRMPCRERRRTRPTPFPP